MVTDAQSRKLMEEMSKDGRLGMAGLRASVKHVPGACLSRSSPAAEGEASKGVGPLTWPTTPSPAWA